MGKVTIILKGNNAKKVFLDKISQDSGIHFKNVPKATIILETRDSSIAKDFFKDFSNQNLLDEVEFEGLDVNENPKEKNFKNLGIKQKDVLMFLKYRPNQLFSAKEILKSIWISEVNLERILASLISRNLIQKTEEMGIIKYYYPSNEELEKLENAKITGKNPISVTEFFG